MNYLFAILLPPLSILLAGRPILAIVTFLIWIPALIFSGGLTHPMFILLAWFIIFEGRNKRA
ncbi:hypothetical protein [Jannaschia ovalis]|uniref:Glucose-inhibited division protein A n=1 Tax=Jannaschia ovalis TaxID=3038773 RepID=A0ABY8LE39_9RHOB|nr:hypothetical protein [Jannaschia sp. GRR-S6-38]WGH79586.1 hypothetical protein P8627_04800 [Jannaschia sp. GRR-S6-38]